VVYLPLRLFHRGGRKELNPPDAGEILVT
jgi:hypothetical protein